MSNEKSNNSNTHGNTESVMHCEEIQDLLFDYMSRELGESRSAFVREHLRKCPDCQAAAREIKDTVDLLHAASADQAGLPERLSEDRRHRILWAVMHPILDWIYSHHILVSLVMTIMAALVGFCVLRKVHLWTVDMPTPGPTVIIGTAPTDHTASAPAATPTNGPVTP